MHERQPLVPASEVDASNALTEEHVVDATYDGDFVLSPEPRRPRYVRGGRPCPLDVAPMLARQPIWEVRIDGLTGFPVALGIARHLGQNPPVFFRSPFPVAGVLDYLKRREFEGRLRVIGVVCPVETFPDYAAAVDVVPLEGRVALLAEHHGGLEKELDLSWTTKSTVVVVEIDGVVREELGPAHPVLVDGTRQEVVAEGALYLVPVEFRHSRRSCPGPGPVGFTQSTRHESAAVCSDLTGTI